MKIYDASELTIRPARPDDLAAIRAIFETAVRYMRSEGNLTQWAGEGFPGDRAASDIEKGQLFVGTDEEDAPHFVFAFIIGDDPTYQVIEDGKWPSDAPYGTIHRAAHDTQVHGVMKAIVPWCLMRIPTVRCDTHADNKTMQKKLLECGFRYCGIIYVSDGSPRKAYQLG
jgi:hypothetical protein